LSAFEIDLLSLSPERRRLRFSFQINNVKDPEPKLPEPPLSGTIRLAPDVGGGGYLSNLEFHVKSFFSKPSDVFFRTSPKAKPEELAASKEANQSSQLIILKKTSKQSATRLSKYLETLASPFRISQGGRLLTKPKLLVNQPF
jgi:hypothetical protein